VTTSSTLSQGRQVGKDVTIIVIAHSDAKAKAGSDSKRRCNTRIQIKGEFVCQPSPKTKEKRIKVESRGDAVGDDHQLAGNVSNSNVQLDAKIRYLLLPRSCSKQEGTATLICSAQFNIQP
jgi:hypothetical protein